MLPDGSRLQVRLADQLELLRNGKPVPGSPTDPAAILNQSCRVVFYIGGTSLLWGLLAEIVGDRDSSAGLHWASVLVGAVFVLLGFMVKRRSKVALTMTVALMAGLLLWKIFGTLPLFSQGGAPKAVMEICVGVAFVIVICGGFGAIRQLEVEGAEQSRAGTS